MQFPPPRLNCAKAPVHNRGMGEKDLNPDDSGARVQEVERLFRDHNDSLIRFLTLRLQSRQEAREVAQEAYVRLLQLERADVASFVRAYLFRIAGNLAIDRLRRRATESRFQEPELFDDFFEKPLNPETVALERERMEQIRGFLSELPETVRDAFLMFRMEDMDQESIARRLGVTDRMVRNHITRALMYCRLRLEGVAPADATLRLKTGAAS
jgi:RNA polymerase sigma factor (sigma-70 family)